METIDYYMIRDNLDRVWLGTADSDSAALLRWGIYAPLSRRGIAGWSTINHPRDMSRRGRFATLHGESS